MHKKVLSVILNEVSFIFCVSFVVSDLPILRTLSGRPV